MDLLGALCLLIVVLVVVRPILQERRERKLAEQLARLDDPAAAGAFVDRAVCEAWEEAGLFRNLKRFVWPFLFR
jgi:hypothetical protein